MEKPAFDAFSRDYARLAFGIERHAPGFIDAYFGPEEERATWDSEPAPTPDELVAMAEDLSRRITGLQTSDSRRGYLDKQVTAMLTLARGLAGERLPYRDEVRLLFDVEPEMTPEAMYEEAIGELDRLLPGDGTVAERMNAWKDAYVVSPDIAIGLVDLILPELRRRTLTFVDLPDDEQIEVRLVSDEPWSGYNWYLGNGRSRVDLNTDLPIHAFRLTDLLAHEGYPGHHTEHTLKERLYLDKGFGEHALQLINTPECAISEGIATMAESIVFSPEELVAFRRDVVYPAAGISGDPEREIAIAEARAVLRSVPGNAALLLHQEHQSPDDVVAYLMRYALSTEEEARQRLRFISDPLWRAYIFTYHTGRDLVSAWLDGLPESERRARFSRLLREQVYPSQLASWASGGDSNA